MKGNGLKSIISLLILSFFITSVSAGNVVFRDGKIISSGNVSTDDKFVGDGSQLTNLSTSSGNPFNQNLNTSNDVTFRNLTVQNVTSNNINIKNQYTGGGLFIKGIQSSSSSPTVRLGNESTDIVTIGLALANGHFSSMAKIYDTVIRLGGNNIILALNDSDTLLFSENKKNINITNNVSAKSGYFSERVTAKNDVCISGGVCLNKTIEVNTANKVASSLVYYNGSGWVVTTTPAGANDVLRYCGPPTGLTWMGEEEACPI